MESLEKTSIKAKNIFLILFSQLIGIVVGLLSAFTGVFTGLMGLGVVIGIIVPIAACIYPLVMLTKMSSEINEMCDDGEHLMPYICAVLLGVVTLGIYYIYYLYRMQNRLSENADKYNVVITERGGSVILWFLLLLLLFGIGPIISLAIIIRSFNKLAYGYNECIISKNYDNVSTQKRGKISCLSGDMKGAEIIMTQKEPILIIGRDPERANLVIPDKKISKQHCIIRFDSEEICFFIRDCNSTNGTSLSNGIRLLPDVETKITKGSKLILPHNTIFYLEIEETKIDNI